MNLPSYKSKASFNRYAPIIASAVDVYPGVIKIEPVNLALETFNSRFRYAIQSAIEFGYEHPQIDPVKFKQIAGNIRCVMRNGHCLIGPISAIKTYDNDVKNVDAKTQNGQTEYEFTGTFKELYDLASIISKRMLSPIPLIVVRNLDSTAKTAIEDTLDVLFDQDKIDPTKWRII